MASRKLGAHEMSVDACETYRAQVTHYINHVGFVDMIFDGLCNNRVYTCDEYGLHINEPYDKSWTYTEATRTRIFKVKVEDNHLVFIGKWKAKDDTHASVETHPQRFCLLHLPPDPFYTPFKEWHRRPQITEE